MPRYQGPRAGKKGADVEPNQEKKAVSGEGGRPRLPSLRAHLVLLALALLVPALAAAALILHAGYRHNRQEVDKHLLETTRALTLAVDRQFGQAEALLWSLAASPQLHSRDYAAFDALARAATRLPDAWVVVEEPGRQVVNTRLPLGSPLPKVDNQDHWKGLAYGQLRVSNLFIGIVAQRPTVAVDALITSEDGTPHYVSVIMPAGTVSRILADQGLPSRWTGAILDRNGIVVARSRDADRFVGKPATADNLDRLRNGVTQGVFESVSLDGTETVMGLARSPSSGWSTILALPRSEVSAGAWNLARILAVASSLLLALGAALALAMARRIARPVEALLNDALALRDRVDISAGSNQAGPEFRETAALRQAMYETREALRQREQERDHAFAALKEVNESLEARVEERTKELASANASLRESQSVLAEREALYAGVFYANTDGLFVVQIAPDGELFMEAYNAAVENLSGRPVAQSAGRRLKDIVPDDFYPLMEMRIRNCLDEEQVTQHERTYTFGQRRGTWTVTLVPIRNAEGRIARVLGCLRDITREREAETELRESRDRYSTLFQHSPLDLAVVALKADGRIVYEEANPGLLRSLGFTREQFLDHTPHEVFSAEVADYVTKRYRACISTQSVVEYEVSGRTPIGDVVRRTVLVPLFNADGQVIKVLVTSMDLTEQRRVEEQLRQAQRLEAVGQLTGGIAHDFNNLLTVVMGNLDMLRRAKPERAPRLIDNALGAVEHGRKLTSQLLAFSRRHPMKPEAVDLHALIGGMTDMLVQSLRGDISLEIDLADNLWPIEVDPAQLQASLINLAANARDAMSKGGRFSVRARNMVSQDSAAIERVAIEVSDTGVGIPPDALARVFEPFFTTKPVGQGTGLGLAQVYGFVQQSGGSVDIRSEVGRGTTVTLLLGRAQSKQADTHSKASAGSAEAIPASRILLVEDNPQVAELVIALLEEREHRVRHFALASEALEHLYQDAAFDLLLSDLVMPGTMDGLDLARAVRAHWPSMPILLATGYSDAVDRAVREGFPILGKPYSPAELDEALRRLILRKSRNPNVVPFSPRQA